LNALDLTFKKSSRLLNKKAYSFVFHKAQRTKVKYITMLHRINASTQPRLGIIIPKKQVKRAVHRNQIKRVVRESFRMNQHTMCGIDIVFLGYKGIELLSRAELRQHVDALWERMSQL
jgi:ribonuclease P protein component